MAALADLGPISPELVLVCPELRAALVEDYRGHETERRPRLTVVEPSRAGSQPPPRLVLVPAMVAPAVPVLAAPTLASPSRPPVALAAAAYAVQRLALVVTQSVVIVMLLVLVIAVIQFSSI